MPDPILRPATARDLAGVEALVAAAYTPWVAIIGATPGPMLDDYAAAIAKGQVQVIDGAAGIEALLVLIPQPGALLLDNMAVHPDAQRKGHGARLMQAAVAAARTGGHDCLRLYTHEKMTSNIDRYLRAGFQITEHVTERGLNRVYMERPIPPAP